MYIWSWVRDNARKQYFHLVDNADTSQQVFILHCVPNGRQNDCFPDVINVFDTLFACALMVK